MLYVLIFPLIVLQASRPGRAWPATAPPSLNNGGPHGLSEMLYAYTSAAGNNGSAFGGLNSQHVVVERQPASPCWWVASS